MSQQGWIQALADKGPFALLVFFAAVVYWLPRKKSDNPPWLTTGVAAGIWASIFILSGLVIFFWYKVNFKPEYTIVGRIGTLRNDETIFSAARELWFQKEYQPNLDLAYLFRIASTEPLPDGQTIEFEFDSGEAGEHKASRHKLTIRKEFYSKPVDIAFDRASGKFFYQNGGKRGDELPQVANSRTLAPPAWWRVTGSVHAQSPQIQAKPSAARAVEAVNSYDPILRRRGCDMLLAMGRTAIPDIDRALANPKIPPRTKASLVTTLLQMPDGGGLSAEAYAGVRELAASRDEGAAEGAKYLKKYPPPALRMQPRRR